VKLLFDQNLSHKLVHRVSSVFPESTHLFKLGLHEADDSTVWEYARDHGFTFVTQDADFYEISLLKGFPPKIIWLRCGNTSTYFIQHLLERNEAIIRQFINDEERVCLELY
jgi:predicted nuclease of predicted toxin-antitoxin system